MKFWLNKDTESIYLDQLIKASGLMDDYKEIVKVIHEGKITVNGETILKRRKMIYEGDEIRFSGNFIKIVGRKELVRLEKVTAPPEGKISHGKTIHQWHGVDIDKGKKQ